MPTPPIAQIILTLWLLAAVAPAATALFHGSLRSAAPSRSPAQARVRGEKSSLQVNVNAARDSVAAVANAGQILANADRSATARGLSALDLAGREITGVSLLHTALQRHRPRLA